MTKDEALRLALEALESTGENDGYHGVDQYFDNVLVEKAITAIKEALETKDEQRIWVKLTDEEIESVYMNTMNFQQNAKALETKLKEKNT